MSDFAQDLTEACRHYAGVVVHLEEAVKADGRSVDDQRAVGYYLENARAAWNELLHFSNRISAGRKGVALFESSWPVVHPADYDETGMWLGTPDPDC